MNLWIFSDLHQEFSPGAPGPPKPSSAGALIALGDIDLGLDGLDLLRHYRLPGIYVLGNHEYYGHQVSGLNAEADRRRGRLKPTARSHQILDGAHFLAVVLWADFEKGDWFSMQACKSQVSDFEMTQDQGRRLSPERVFRLFQDDCAWLESELAALMKSGGLERTAVCTHFAPSIQSSAPEYKDSAIRSFFSSNLEGLIQQYQPRYWFHGHMHSSSDYLIGQTRVLCNPRGYPHELNPDFVPDLVVGI